MRAALALVLAACGGGLAAPDAAPDAFAGCVAMFAGNFTERSTASSCTALDAGTLAFTVPAVALDAPLTATIELGGGAAGVYSSETVATWSATAMRTVTHSICLASAGNAVAPHGDFMLTLELDSDDAAHGTLALELYVHAAPFTDCGPDLVETVDLAF